MTEGTVLTNGAAGETGTNGLRPGKETRHVVVGHLQRGGMPTAFDRTLATVRPTTPPSAAQ